jgi:hypothetical protein
MQINKVNYTPAFQATPQKKENEFVYDSKIAAQYQEHDQKAGGFFTFGLCGLGASFLFVKKAFTTSTEKLPKIALMAAGAVASLGSAILLIKASFEVDKPKK